MSKEIRNTVSDADISKLEVIKDAVVFLPSPAQRRAKARFQARSEGMITRSANTSAQSVSSITGEPGVIKWWAVPGFREWFFNEQETKERLEYLFMLALDAAEEVLLNPEANASAKVNMIKVLAILAGKDQSKDQRVLDDSIQRMTPAQLREYIKQKAPKVLESDDNQETD